LATFQASNVKITSTENEPLSTKSPLNKYGISSDGYNVWVSSQNDSNVYQFDIPTFLADPNPPTYQNYVSINSTDITSDGKNVWGLDIYNSNAYQINIASFLTSQGISKVMPVGINPKGISSDGTYVWVANGYSENSILQIKIQSYTLPTTPTYYISTFAGIGSGGYSGDNGPATQAKLSSPSNTFIDNSGNMYVADTYNSRIRKINTQNIITTIAGKGVSGYTGDNKPAIQATLNYPVGIWQSSNTSIYYNGNIYFSDTSNHAIRMIDTNGNIKTIAGGNGTGFSGDGGPPTGAKLNGPTGIWIDNYGNIYFADTNNHAIRYISNPGHGHINIATIAGGNGAGYGGDGNSALYCNLNYPTGVVSDNSGSIYVIDYGNYVVRQFGLYGNSIINTIIGSGGNPGYNGDGLGTSIYLKDPVNAFYKNGYLYINVWIGNAVKFNSNNKFAQ
jgi:hypothetical protein